MQNYYEEKFENLFLKFGMQIAKERIVEDLLYKSSQPKIVGYQNKFDMFWQSNFIRLLTVDDVKDEKYILALSQYIRFNLANKSICLNYLNLDVQSFILAIRYSGIIQGSKHNSWVVIKEISRELNIDQLKSFVNTVEYLQQQYEYRLENQEEIKNNLHIGQITAMIFGSLYAYEYLIPHQDYFDYLPYQFDRNESNSAETVWKAFDEIVKTSKKNTKKLSEGSIALALKNKLMPFLIGEGMTPQLLQQYELYKKFVAIKVEIINYQRNVLESFCYDKNINYKLKKSELIYIDSKDKNDNWSKKNSLFWNYWLGVGVEKLLNSDAKYSIINTGDNLEANAIALAKAFGIQEQLEQVYGISDLSINNQKFDVYETMITMTLSQAHYLKDHIEKFMVFLIDSESNLQALTKLTMHGFLIGENRMPFTYANRADKVKRMSSWIRGSSNNIKKKKMDQILNFWAYDLYDDADLSIFQQKPFYKIDDYIFQFPWLSAYQNLNSAVINYCRKLHKNRIELKGETNQLELNLAEKIKNLGFEVYPQFMPEDKDVGEIDLIAVYQNHILVIELKTSYIRSSIKEIYEYRNFTLNKAAYQLTKKLEYVKNTFVDEQILPIENIKFHSWIVDTTLEFDHHYFGRHLKVSLEELVIVMANKTDFMQKIISGEFEEDKDAELISPLDFLEKIEKNQFWDQQINDYQNNLDKMLAKLDQ